MVLGKLDIHKQRKMKPLFTKISLKRFKDLNVRFEAFTKQYRKNTSEDTGNDFPDLSLKAQEIKAK